ncbi:MAG TPA: lipid-A-disaccharide synthase [bacterium]|nr:lipid-A-disaccharide synthase [bacterium]HOM26036.1 lipid-A-disaccharide synthase [bacterium]
MKICILAGEKSGDNYGALLCRNFKKEKKDIFIFGTGGREMEKEGAKLIKGFPFGQMGFSGVLKKIFPYISFMKKVIKEIEKEKPDIIIFIDNPGFNLEIAKRLKRKYKTFYYIPPKIWAHNYRRIKILKKYIDFVIPIFHFEVDIYRKENIPYVYFGHPVIDLIKTEVEKFEKKGYIIGILPGSRREELIYNLPAIKDVIKNLKNELDFDVWISSLNEEFKEIIKKIFKDPDIEYKIEKDLYYLIENSDVILSVSGTVNLEVAYLKKPMVVFYRTSFLNYFLCRFIVNVDFISPVNLILNEKVVPEYIQNFRIKDVVNDIINLIERKDIYKKQIEGYERMIELLGEKNISEKICRFIIEGVKN